MSKFFEAMERRRQQSASEKEEIPYAKLSAVEPIATPAAIVSVAPMAPVIGKIARSRGIQRISERIAAVAMAGDDARLLISGCRPCDGATTIATALALDLSQRLSLRSLFLDAHLRHSSGFRMLLGSNSATSDLLQVGQVQSRTTTWSRLDVARCRPPQDSGERKTLLEEVQGVTSNYAVTIVDLGVLRLDSRMLSLSRPSDPALLIVRQGKTEKSDLAATAGSFAAANRPIAGVILNAYESPIPDLISRLIGPFS
jgi:Mrp family chromosome partitioning ATPase